MAEPRLVSIRGIMQRSGTNFVHDLFRLHPDCATHPSVHEDHMFAAADLLLRYVDDTVGSWRPDWPLERDAEAAMLASRLGAALTAYLAADSGRPVVVTKMPSMDGIELALRLLPDAAHVAVVRDGRSVVESATTSFREPFDREARRWVDGARRVLAAREAFGAKLLVVRYEDLLTDLRPTLERLLDHAGLDLDRYPFDEAAELPVRGSSELAATGAVHWTPVPRASVRPERRAAGWSDAQRSRFDRIAGLELAAFGYERDLRRAPRPHLPSPARLRWEARRAGGRLRRWLRDRL